MTPQTQKIDSLGKNRSKFEDAIRLHRGYRPFMLTDIARDILDQVSDPKGLGKQFAAAVDRGEFLVKETPIPKGAKHNNHYRKLYPHEAWWRTLRKLFLD